MAIYHLSANVLSRARGQSIVAAAAYRAGARLRDHRYGIVHNYAGRRVCAHAEIMAPDGTPAWVHDRESLWNRVEAAERRKDSQLARVIEVGLPLELTPDESLRLVRDYVTTVFVARGMIADVFIRGDSAANPHAHILLTLRGVTEQGFGRKERRWNGRANLIEWRAAWADLANLHLARAGHGVRIDHRTLEAQQVELTPARRIGVGRPSADAADLPEHLTERISEQRRIARSNGDTILADPSVALRVLTHQSPTFCDRDLERFLHSRTADDVQFHAALAAVRQSTELIALSRDEAGVQRFTSADMVEASKSLRRRVASMAARRSHAITHHSRAAVVSDVALIGASARAFEHLVGEGAAKAVVLPDDHHRRMLLEALVAACRSDGLHVVHATPQALTSIEMLWQQGHEVLTGNSVVVLEAVEMIGLKQLERVIGAVDRARAKVVLIGDAARLGALGRDTVLWSMWEATKVEAR